MDERLYSIHANDNLTILSVLCSYTIEGARIKYTAFSEANPKNFDEFLYFFLHRRKNF